MVSSQKISEPLTRLVRAAEPHVVFTGWGTDTLSAAATDVGMELGEARALCPDGPRDLAAARHRLNDQAAADAIEVADFSGLAYRAKVAEAIKLRLAQENDREVTRRAMSLFALPLNASLGAKLIWETADMIWNALGDSSQDVNWYSKRAILSGVYGSTAMVWLNDNSDGHGDTWAFLDRRIEDVMRIEKVKADIRGNPLLKRAIHDPLTALLAPLKAPGAAGTRPGPGYWDRDKFE